MLRIFLFFWVPVSIWCGLIFWWSSIPHLAIAEGAADFWTRKPAHMAEYAILFLLLYRAVQRGALHSWSLRALGLVGLLTMLYAASDELHQHFVIGRTGKIADLGFDFAGVLLGVGFVAWWRMWRKAVHQTEESDARV
jgi:VanZ family protein